jgi:hypothetical protein
LSFWLPPSTIRRKTLLCDLSYGTTSVICN